MLKLKKKKEKKKARYCKVEPELLIKFKQG